MSPRDPVTGPLSGTHAEYTLVILGTQDEEPPGFLLGAARLALGAGDEDDVFLSGVGVVPGHVRVIFLDGQLTLLSATEEVRIDGVPVAAFPVELQPLQTLSLSPDTHLSYGPVGSAWPKPPVWEVASVEEGAEHLEVVPSTHSGLPAKIRPAPRTVRQRVVHSARLGSVVVGVAALLMVAVVLFDLIWGNREVVNPSEVSIDRAALVLKDMLARDPERFGSVKMERREDGAITLRGFVDSDDAYRALAEQVRQQVVSSGGNVRFDTLTKDRLEALVRDQISRYPLASQVDVTPEAIRVAVFGIETDAVDTARLTAELGRLKQRVQPRRMDITVHLEPVSQVTAEIAAKLSGSPITRELQFSIGDTGGMITGLVAPAAEPEAKRFLIELLQAYANRIPLSFDLKVDPKLNFSLVGVTVGGEAASATLVQRGRSETFRVGESVFETGELREIRRNGVVVALGRRELFIPLSMR